MSEFKITHGFVRQDFVDGKCVGQNFVAGPVDWEDELGNPISDPNHLDVYQPFDMVQPEGATDE